MPRIAVVGGIGLRDFLDSYETVTALTRYHDSGSLIERSIHCMAGQVSGNDVICLNRHRVGDLTGSGGYLRPDEIDYCAYMTWLKKQGVTHVLSSSDVDSGNIDAAPQGSIVLASDYADMTGNGSSNGSGRYFADMRDPFSLRRQMLLASEGVDRIVGDGIYVSHNRGLARESAAEVRFYNAMLGNGGVPVIFGLAVPPEAKMARFFGLEYGCAALVTGAAAGAGPGIREIDRKAVIEKNAPRMNELLRRTMELIE